MIKSALGGLARAASAAEMPSSHTTSTAQPMPSMGGVPHVGAGDHTELELGQCGIHPCVAVCVSRFLTNSKAEIARRAPHPIPIEKMARLMLILALGSATHALQVPAVFTRRGAVTALVALPCAASAAEFSGYKERDYGNGANTALGTVPKKPITQCEEGQRLSPDGFGGKK